MKKILSKGIVTLALVVAAGVGTAHADTTLQFEGATIDFATGALAGFVNEGGYTYTDVSAGEVSVSQSGNGGQSLYGYGNGAGQLQISGAGAATAVFNFVGLDYGGYGLDFGQNLLVYGYRNGSLVGQDNFVPEVCADASVTDYCWATGTADDLKGKPLDKLYFQLRADETRSGVGFQAVDNVRLVAATPEPSSIALLGTGLLGVAGTMRRKFSRT